LNAIQFPVFGLTTKNTDSRFVRDVGIHPSGFFLLDSDPRILALISILVSTVPRPIAPIGPFGSWITFICDPAVAFSITIAVRLPIRLSLTDSGTTLLFAFAFTVALPFPEFFVPEFTSGCYTLIAFTIVSPATRVVIGVTVEISVTAVSSSVLVSVSIAISV
jgi:hypothetical protein